MISYHKRDPEIPEKTAARTLRRDPYRHTGGGTEFIMKDYQSELPYIGDISQLFDVRTYRLCGGRAEGVLAVEIWNGDRLTVTVLPDRGMDIYSVRYNNREMSWHSPAGIVHPAYYSSAGSQWLRTFQGGFLATCGLEWIGSADPDAAPGEGLHGRHNPSPAENISVKTEFDAAGEPVCVISGEVRHALLFGVRYTLKRTFRFRRNENSFSFTDEITNGGFADQPLYLLYHFNLGYPLISETAELLIDPVETIPANDYSAAFADEWPKVTPPVPGYRQQNYYHVLEADSEGFRHYGVRNRAIGTGMTVSFSSPVIDRIFQWKNLASGDYVMGLEPVTPAMPAGEAEERGDLRFVAPGETVTNEFVFEFDRAN